MHIAEMDAYHEHFLREYRHAVAECKRLEALLNDVVWYNFETVARAWKEPWPASWLESTLTLHAQRYQLVPTRGGRRAEKADFPVYYSGPLRDAPRLPPAIVLAELQLARSEVARAEEACAAVYECAPGGRLYEKMLR